MLRYIIGYILGVTLLVLLLYLLSGCDTAKRSARQVTHAILDYPEQTARQVRTIWPCDTTGTDTVLIEADNSGYDAMIEALSAEIGALYDSLGIKDTVRITTERLVIKRLQGTRPKPDTVRLITRVTDMAAVAVCDEERRALTASLIKQTGKADRWHDTARKRSYVMYGLMALIVIWIAYKIIRLIK